MRVIRLLRVLISERAAETTGPANRLARFLWLCSFLLLLTTSVVPLAESAAIDPFLGKKVVEIRFASQDRIDTRGLQQIVPLKEGSPLQPETVRESIEVLFRTREFGYIEVDAEHSPEGVVVTFNLQANYFFADFRLGGNLVLRTSISSVTQLPLGEVYSRKSVDTMLEKLSQALRADGYYQAQVIPNIQFRREDLLVVLEFIIQSGPRARFSEIILDGRLLLEKEEVLDKMKLHVGSFVDNEALRKDLERVRKLYSDRGFLNASVRVDEIRYTPENNSAVLNLNIDAGEFVYIELIGAKLSKSEVRSLVPIYEEGSIDQDLIEEGRRNIEDHFERQGYFDVSVISEFIAVPEQNAYQINYSIDRGKKQKVVSLDFNGVTYFNENQLTESLRTKVGGLTGKGKFSRDLLEEDAEAIKNLYLRSGFENAQVKASTEKDASGENIAVTFSIEEGPQTHVAAIHLQGNQSLSAGEIQQGLGLAPGQPFSPIQMEEDRRAIEYKYQDRGFVDVRVASQVDRLPDQRVRVTHVIQEDERMRVAEIHVVGNRLTREKIIGRNLDFHQGDPLTQERLLTSQQQLYSLGLFKRVDIVPIRVDPVDSYRPVIIRIEDASPIILGYGAGYQDNEGVRGTVEISHNNLWGLARSLSFRTRVSQREQRGQLTYKEPRLFNRDLDSFVTLFVEKRAGPSFSTRRTNASIQVLKRFSPFDNYFVRYNFETVDLSDIRVNPLATGQEGTLQLSSISTAWLRDTRDDPIDPTSGFFGTANFSVKSRYLGSKASFLSFFGQAQAHRKIKENITLASSFRLGLTNPTEKTNEIPISERFFAGGSTTLRAFNLDCAGPLDVQKITPENEDQARRVNCGNPTPSEYYAPLGGNALLIANLEVRIPLTSSISFVPFYDTGNVFSAFRKIRFGDFTNTAGFGVRYKTPFGPLRVDLGFNFDRPPGVPNRQIFFTIGNPF